jgi:hypothetical protein
MKGLRLAIGVVVMGVAVPAVLFFLLKLTSLSQFFTIGAVCFVAWGVADLTANIFDLPRLEDRTPGSALRDWEKSKTETPEGK